MVGGILGGRSVGRSKTGCHELKDMISGMEPAMDRIVGGLGRSMMSSMFMLVNTLQFL